MTIAKFQSLLLIDTLLEKVDWLIAQMIGK